jgi:predicted nucleotidyltransferase
MNALQKLESALGASWEALTRAREAAERQHATLAECLQEAPTDADIVVFGSLARGEWTQGSDLDWTLLVNGPARRDHRTTVNAVRKAIAKANMWRTPGPTELFGGITFSHELVHRIGGEADTNRITTQRVLLLLESRRVDNPGADVRSDVVRAVLDAYLDDADAIRQGNVPRFLLNDVVRYWRTLGVDFAAKMRERDNHGWALRRLKLRTSRKLIFAAGLVMSLEPWFQQVAGNTANEDSRAKLLGTLVDSAEPSPLDTIATAASKNRAPQETCRQLFDAYNRFIALLDDPEARQCLQEHARGEVNEVVNKADEIGRNFGEAVEDFFFNPKSEYAPLMRKYGVF